VSVSRCTIPGRRSRRSPQVGASGCSSPVHQGAVAVARGWVHGQPPPLLEHDQVGVLRRATSKRLAPEQVGSGSVGIHSCTASPGRRAVLPASIALTRTRPGLSIEFPGSGAGSARRWGHQPAVRAAIGNALGYTRLTRSPSPLQRFFSAARSRSIAAVAGGGGSSRAMAPSRERGSRRAGAGHAGVSPLCAVPPPPADRPSHPHTRRPIAGIEPTDGEHKRLSPDPGLRPASGCAVRL